MMSDKMKIGDAVICIDNTLRRTIPTTATNILKLYGVYHISNIVNEYVELIEKHEIKFFADRFKLYNPEIDPIKLIMHRMGYE